MSYQRFSQRVIDQVDNDGNVICCRQCGAAVRPPFIYYCSWHCAHGFRMRTSQQYAHRVVGEAWGWRCANCGVDTKRLERENRDDTQLAVRRRKSFAHAHHKNAVVENGGEARSEAEYELLCPKCHRVETTKLVRGLARKRRKERLIIILRALNSPELKRRGATLKSLQQMVQQPKSAIQTNLCWLRRHGYLERSKQGDFYITAQGRDALRREDEKAAKMAALLDSLSNW